MSYLNENLIDRTLEEIENDYWKNISFPTGLVEKVFLIRKKKLKDLLQEDLRLMLSQKMGLNYAVPLAIDVLKNNLMTDAGIYEGDILESLLKIPSEFWKNGNGKQLAIDLKNMVESQYEKISLAEISEEIKNGIVKTYVDFKNH